MFSSYLNRRGKGKGEGNDGLIMSNVEKLGGLETFVLKGSKLSIGPPVLGPRHDVQQSRRIGWKRASCEFGRDH